MVSSICTIFVTFHILPFCIQKFKFRINFTNSEFKNITSKFNENDSFSAYGILISYSWQLLPNLPTSQKLPSFTGSIHFLNYPLYYKGSNAIPIGSKSAKNIIYSFLSIISTKKNSVDRRINSIFFVIHNALMSEQQYSNSK